MFERAPNGFFTHDLIVFNHLRRRVLQMRRNERANRAHQQKTPASRS